MSAFQLPAIVAIEVDEELSARRRAVLSSNQAIEAANVRSGGPARLAIFFSIVILAMAMIQASINAGLRRIETSTFGVFNKIVNGHINASILVTGSSRASNHYDPREITRRTGLSAWNIGVDGSQTDMQLAVLQTYLHHNTAPVLLIHNLDSFAFVTSREGIAFPETYVPYLGEPAIYNTLTRIDTTWWKAKYLPLYGYAIEDMRFTWMLGIQSLAHRNPAEVRFAGFEPRATAWTEDFEHFRQANPNGVSFAIDPEAIRDFEQIVEEVASRRGQVLLVYSPVYYEMQKLDRKRSEVFARFEDIARRHHALLWDYSESAISKRRELFYNSQHLNADGAAAFSASLADRIATSPLIDRHRASN
jgi:hypothetical protein